MFWPFGPSMVMLVRYAGTVTVSTLFIGAPGGALNPSPPQPARHRPPYSYREL
jgi:hypothetical protein